MGLKECWTYVRSDLYRITGKKQMTWMSLLREGFFDIGLCFGSDFNAYRHLSISFLD